MEIDCAFPPASRCPGFCCLWSWHSVQCRLEPRPDYGPTHGWRTSTPEAQGMQSDVLAAMFTDLTDSEHSIDSVTIIRNGYIVLDAYSLLWASPMSDGRPMPRASMSGSAGRGSNRTTWPSSGGCFSTRVSGTDEWSYSQVGSMTPPGGISKPNHSTRSRRHWTVEPEIPCCLYT